MQVGDDGRHYLSKSRLGAMLHAIEDALNRIQLGQILYTHLGSLAGRRFGGSLSVLAG
jgi:hypothetical protein